MFFPNYVDEASVKRDAWSVTAELVDEIATECGDVLTTEERLQRIADEFSETCAILRHFATLHASFGISA